MEKMELSVRLGLKLGLKRSKKSNSQLKKRFLRVWDVDAAGSNPVTPTISSVHSQSDERSIFFLPILDCLEQGFYSFCYQ